MEKEKLLLLYAETYRQALTDMKEISDGLFEKYLCFFEKKIKHLKKQMNSLEYGSYDEGKEHGLKIALQKVIQTGNRYKEMGYKYDKHDPFESIVNDIVAILQKQVNDGQ